MSKIKKTIHVYSEGKYMGNIMHSFFFRGGVGR